MKYINENGISRPMTPKEEQEYLKQQAYFNSPQFLIPQYKQNLADTDYQSIKHSEGEMSDEEFEPIKAQRKAWREEINRLEKML